MMSNSTQTKIFYYTQRPPLYLSIHIDVHGFSYKYVYHLNKLRDTGRTEIIIINECHQENLLA